MDQLYDLTPELGTGDHLFKADLADGYYHIHLRSSDGIHLALFVGDDLYITLCLNPGLVVSLWFFTKAMSPFLAFLRRLGHLFFSYIDNVLGQRSRFAPGGTSPADKQALGRLICLLFGNL